jgi:hypothetical protein
VGALRAHPRAAVLAALAVVPLVLLRAALFEGGVLYQRDVHLYWHAEAEAFVRAIAAGAWPSWDPTLGFGQPLLANSSAQVLYPPTWLNLVLRPWRYYTAFVLLHLVLSAAGAYRAARGAGCSRGGAVVGAMAWTASGPFVSLAILWHHFAGAAWLPWVVAASLRFEATRRGVLALGLTLGAQQLAGSFDMSAMGAALCAVLVLHRLDWPRPWAGERNRRLFAAAAAAFALGAALSAGQWMATAEVAAHSGRRVLPREVRTYWSVHPLTLADFVLPGLSAAAPVSPAVRRELFEGREPFLASLYLGLAASLLALSALVDAERRRFALLLGAVAALAGLVALGRHAPAYDLLVGALPPLKAFRYPVKATVLVALAWSLLVALGFEAWRRDPAAGLRAARAFRAISAAVVILGAAAAAALLAAGAPGAARNAAVACAFAALAAATWAIRTPGARTGPAAVAAGLAVCDLLLYHRGVNAVSPKELYTHRPEVLRHLPSGDGARLYAYDYSAVPTPDSPRRAAARLARAPAGWDPDPANALAQQMALTPVAASRFGVRGSYEVDYTGLFPVHVNQAAYLLRSLEGTPGHLRMLQLGGVTHVVALHEETFRDLQPVAVVPGLFDRPIRLFAVPDPMPRTYVAATARAGEGMAGLAALVDPRFDFRREVLLPAGAPRVPSEARGSSRVVEEGPTLSVLDVDAPDGGYVVLLESYDPGWRATVDGEPAEVLPANVLFRAVRVGPGRHRVRLEYRPPAQAAGLAVSGLALAVAAALARRGRARPAAAIA